MAKLSEKQRVAHWQSRVDAADKIYKKWEERFKVADLENEYLGEQWHDGSEGKYVINLIFPTIETRKPSLLFYQPVFKIHPKPSKVDDPNTNIEERVRLREDTLNSIVSDMKLEFERIIKLCIHEAHFRFAVVEVGYSADFIDNPNLGKPVLSEDSDEPLLDEENKPIIDTNPKRITAEHIYIKRVPAANFRTSVRNSNLLSWCDWCGYYEWVYLEDIKKNPHYKNTGALKGRGYSSDGPPSDEDSDADDIEKHAGMEKIWKIWDMRAKKRYVWAEGYNKFLLDGEPYELLPFVEPLKFCEILDQFLPFPIVRAWLDPQHELNDTREMQRIHRRRAIRRYGYSGACDQGEVEKLLQSEGDMSCAQLPGRESVWAIEDAPLDPAVARNVPQSRDDFMEISGVTGEQRGISESETATQARIINVRSMIRENSTRREVGIWLGRIGELILRTIETYMTQDFWIQRNVDPLAVNAPQEAARIAATWEEINALDLGDLNYEVSCDIDLLSPVGEEQQRQNWNQLLALMGNLQILMVLATSDLFLRRTLAMYGIRSEREIQEFKRLATLIVAGQATQAVQSPAKAPVLPPPPAPGALPSAEQIDNQLLNQIGFQGPLAGGV